MVIFVCHHSGDGGFRSGPGGSGHRRKGDDLFVDPQQALQLGHRSAWPGKPCCRRLGCIHRAAAADGHHTVAPLRPELGHELLHRLNFRIGRYLVEPAPGRQPFRHSNELRLATIMGFLHPALCSSPGSLSRLPAPVIHSGLRQGSTLAPRPKHAWKTRQYILLSSIALTSLPGSIMPHLGWDCKMKWGGTI